MVGFSKVDEAAARPIDLLLGAGRMTNRPAGKRRGRASPMACLRLIPIAATRKKLPVSGQLVKRASLDTPPDRVLRNWAPGFR
jgi:hypothetical protein